MIIKDYYITPRETLLASASRLAGFHFIDLDAVNVLSSVTHRSESERDTFESCVTINPLPHMFDSTPLTPAQVTALAGIGVQPGHTTKDVRKLARAISRVM